VFDEKCLCVYVFMCVCVSVCVCVGIFFFLCHFFLFIHVFLIKRKKHEKKKKKKNENRKLISFKPNNLVESNENLEMDKYSFVAYCNQDFDFDSLSKSGILEISLTIFSESFNSTIQSLNKRK